MATLVDIGDELREARDGLYREMFPTFESLCDHLGITVDHANHLIDVAEAVIVAEVLVDDCLTGWSA
jgi:hypothetical protein